MGDEKKHVRPESRLSRLFELLPRIAPVVSLAFFILAAWFLHRELAGLSFAEILSQVRASSISRVIAAALFAAGGYAVLTTYDALAMRYIERSVPYHRTALTAFMAFAIGNSLGLTTLAGGPIRYRMYSALGMAGADIARVIVFCSVTFVLGAAILLGASLLTIPSAELALLRIPSALSRTAGAVMLISAVAYLVLPVIRKSPIILSNWQIEVPSIRITTGQAAVSILDLALASATLYLLVGPEIHVSYLAFLGVYLVANSAGLISNVPGGVGVFEAVMLLAFPNASRDVLLSTIILYRLIYYVAPFGVALAVMGGHEIHAHRVPLRAIGGRIADGLSMIAPQVIGTMVFLAGVVLLVSGASPGVETRLRMISQLLPHPVLELSHLAGSLIGLCLLVLARGLYRRLHGAFRIVSALLIVGALASLLKGFDYEEAIVLLFMFALLQMARSEFHRRGSLVQQRFSSRWVAMIVITLLGAAWVGIVSYRHIPYSNELWWQFSLEGDAPRMLRAMLLVYVAAIVFSIRKLMRPAAPISGDITPGDRLAVRRIIDKADAASANAALIDDKRFLFNEAQTAFIMYQISGRTWVALGDPVGPESDREALTWQFLELCDRFDGWPAFYQVSEKALSVYIDTGLTLSKLGEEALVRLSEFSLQGSERADLRQALHRADRFGASFSVVPKGEVPDLVEELAVVSAEWLALKGTSEKGFSLGRFTREYVENFDCAIVTVGGQIVAFANLWKSGEGGEMSVDLMRSSADAPNGVMDFLFTKLILWSKDRGYTWFNMGMAPLSGLEQHPLAPMWHRAGNLVFRHAEDFYNFEGLRRYKEKFSPVWRARYLASPGGLVLSKVLLDTSTLIAGGLTRIVSR